MIRFFLVLVLFLPSCKSGKIPGNSEIDEIKFGNGGGFTGAIKTFTLTKDNKLVEEDRELKRIEKDKNSQLFKMAHELKDYSFNEPGNVYSFLEIKVQGKTNRIVWAPGSGKVDQRAIKLHAQLTSLIK